MKKLLLITVTIILILNCNAQTDSLYFGQTPPGDNSVKFEVYPSGDFPILHSSPSFSPTGKEVFWATYINDTKQTIYYRKWENDNWLDPTIATFSDENYSDKNPCFSGDGNRLYFVSNRPITGIGNTGDENIWYIEKTQSGWSDPFCLEGSTKNGEISIATNNYLYFSKNDKLYCAKWDKDHFLIAEELPLNLTGMGTLGSIAPDESYLILQSDHTYNPSLDLWVDDLYVYFQIDGIWSKPIKIGSEINNMKDKFFARISCDGKYLFFLGDNNDAFWVSTDFVVGLKKIAFAPKKIKQIPNMNITTDSTINYVIPENTFSCEYGTASLKYTATLSNGSALPSWLSFNAETRTLSGTPTQAGTDTLKITATNADTMSASCTFKIKVTSTVSISQLDGQTVGIFPNPTTGLVNISFDNSVKKAKVEIHCVHGTLVFSKTINCSPSATIDLTGNSKGMYLVKVIADGVSYEEKILKE